VRISVTGAGGFIGHHLVKHLKGQGHFVRGIDKKKPVFEESPANEFITTDLVYFANACDALWKCSDRVYHLASNMGGIGFIESHKAEIVLDNTRIDMSVLEAARYLKAERLFYASSACVYPAGKQDQADVMPLKEDDAYPADPEDGYGWEKLYAERMCRHWREDFGLETRVARFHNIYGPLGTWDGGREKSPAAICRKVALAKDGDEIEVWGDGTQTRSYCYVGDAVIGIEKLMESDFPDPLNIGRDDLVSVRDLVGLVAKIAGKKLTLKYDPSKPKGVMGRNADLTRLRDVLGWEPMTEMKDGMAATYRWIESELRKAGRI
jgi:GDP-D-mannose 3',5'-epimerase